MTRNIVAPAGDRPTAVDSARDTTPQLDARPEAQSKPADPVCWVPGWVTRSAKPVTSAAALAAHIATLPHYEYGGIKQLDSSGPWAQVRREDGELLLLELHPHKYGDDDGLGNVMLFDRVVGITATQAGGLAWNWVTRSTLPHGFVYEPRIVPPRSMLDRPL